MEEDQSFAPKRKNEEKKLRVKHNTAMVLQL